MRETRAVKPDNGICARHNFDLLKRRMVFKHEWCETMAEQHVFECTLPVSLTVSSAVTAFNKELPRRGDINVCAAFQCCASQTCVCVRGDIRAMRTDKIRNWIVAFDNAFAW
nr:hypothetical protein [Marivita cryptomonadis]